MKKNQKIMFILNTINKTLSIFGSVTSTVLMDMVEVKVCIQREIGYWKNDTHDNIDRK